MGEPVGHVLYDDSCGFCRRWIPFREQTLRKRGLAITLNPLLRLGHSAKVSRYHYVAPTEAQYAAVTFPSAA